MKAYLISFQSSKTDTYGWFYGPGSHMCLFRPFSVNRGVPAVVDFAAMRDAVKKLQGDPEKINPVCPADLVIDHSIQVDFNRK